MQKVCCLSCGTICIFVVFSAFAIAPMPSPLPCFQQKQRGAKQRPELTKKCHTEGSEGSLRNHKMSVQTDAEGSKLASAQAHTLIDTNREILCLRSE